MLKRTFCVLLLISTILTSASAATYVVKSGDTLWGIAQKYGTTVDELRGANPQLGGKDMIHVGQSLTIPERLSGGTAAGGRESLTYLYAGTATSYLKVLDAASNSINTISPDYFDINLDGSLLITPSNKIDEAFISEMHSRGILVTPFISNHWDNAKGVAALNNRVALSSQVADMVMRYNLDGVNIDIENVNEKHRASYTEFTRLLREKLPADKLVTVAVAANPKGWTLGWHGSYDYKALAQHADYLMLMTYDESFYGGDEGPIASAKFFEDSINYAIKQGVPKSKIVAGLPFFGRFWQQGSSIGGFGITNNDVQYLIENYEYTAQYHDYSQSVNVVVTVKATDAKPKLWGGRVLNTGVYSIWYDNAQSTRWKLELVNSYDIKGAGSWALGQENTGIWSFYTAALNGSTAPPTVTPPPPKITDTTDSLTRILNYLNKHGPKDYNKNSVLTRAELTAVLSELVYLTPAPSGVTFADTAGHWAVGQINALKMRLIVNGKPGNLFDPEHLVTREELLAMLDRLLVLPNTIDYNTMTFRDVAPERWSYANIAKMYYFELIRGYSAEYFKPTETVTAEILSIIVDRIATKEYPMNPDRHITSKIAPYSSRSRGVQQAAPTEPIIEPR